MLKKLTAVASLASLATVGLALPANAQKPPREYHYGWGADGTLMESYCQDYGSYQVCSGWTAF